jgi:hypothetical protein
MCRCDWAFHNRILQKISPTYPGDTLGPVSRTIHLVTAPVRWTVWRAIELTFLLHWRIPRRLWPRQSMSYDTTGEVLNMIPDGFMPVCINSLPSLFLLVEFVFSVCFCTQHFHPTLTGNLHTQGMHCQTSPALYSVLSPIRWSFTLSQAFSMYICFHVAMLV